MHFWSSNDSSSVENDIKENVNFKNKKLKKQAKLKPQKEGSSVV